MRRAIFVVLIVFGLVSCGGHADTIPAKDLSRLVLRANDLGAGYSAFELGPQTSLDNAGTPLADPAAFGRKGGWIGRFHRSGLDGALVVESRADLFGSADGAKHDLSAVSAELAATPAGKSRPLRVQLGDEAVGRTFVQPGGRPLRFFRIAWRDRNATAAVTVQGFDGHVRLADALAIARKQQQRLARS